ncbi:3-hydroxyacyl-CoA dehydrogenase NAD-binding domain-containing protein [Streptomyces canarius]
MFATNTSAIPPSALMDSTGRPDRFLALHFSNLVWRHNIAEVMGTPRTAPDVYASVVGFAASIGMVPIEVKKERPGYVLNSLLITDAEGGRRVANGRHPRIRPQSTTCGASGLAPPTGPAKCLTSLV